MEYKPENYSQGAINAGQRKINYALTLVDEKLIKALEALRDAIKALPATHNAISEVSGYSRQVAGIKPPGCDPDWPA
jgi:hypothetical protein